MLVARQLYDTVRVPETDAVMTLHAEVLETRVDVEVDFAVEEAFVGLGVLASLLKLFARVEVLHGLDSETLRDALGVGRMLWFGFGVDVLRAVDVDLAGVLDGLFR